MPITLTDDDGNEVDLSKADGGFLRKKLEEALADNANLSKQAATSKIGEIVGADGFSLVKAEDLAGVSVGQIEAKAKQVQAERTEVIRSALATKGLEGADLDAALGDFLSGGEPPVPGVQDENFTNTENLGGGRPKRTPDAPPMDDAMGNLTSAFEDQAKSSRKK